MPDHERPPRGVDLPGGERTGAGQVAASATMPRAAGPRRRSAPLTPSRAGGSSGCGVPQYTFTTRSQRSADRVGVLVDGGADEAALPRRAPRPARHVAGRAVGDDGRHGDDAARSDRRRGRHLRAVSGRISYTTRHGGFGKRRRVSDVNRTPGTSRAWCRRRRIAIILRRYQRYAAMAASGMTMRGTMMPTVTPANVRIRHRRLRDGGRGVTGRWAASDGGWWAGRQSQLAERLVGVVGRARAGSPRR